MSEASASRSPIAVLCHRDFGLLWSGQLVSQAGSQMQLVAINWHVYMLTKSAWMLGLVGLFRVVPIIVFSLIGGVVADARDRIRVMLVTQAVMLAVAGALAWVTLRGLPSAWPILVLTAVSSAAIAFDNPARQALIPRLVPVADLPAALSLNVVNFHVATVVGPALAGWVIYKIGIAAIYAINAASFLAVIVALVAMRTSGAVAAPQDGGPVSVAAGWRGGFAALADGLRFVWRTPIIVWTMVLDFFATFFASATALLPIYAEDILGVGARGYGLLAAAPAAGAVVTGVAMSALPPARRQGTLLLWSVCAYGIATIGFGFSRSFVAAAIFLAGTGVADTISTVLRNSIRQLKTPDWIRGRMTSINMIFFMGGPQLGEFEAGAVAAAFGPVAAVVSGGIGCLVAVAIVAAATPVVREYR